MFNVSALLPDDALKLATPLTNGAINETPHDIMFTLLTFFPGRFFAYIWPCPSKGRCGRSGGQYCWER